MASYVARSTFSSIATNYFLPPGLYGFGGLSFTGPRRGAGFMTVVPRRGGRGFLGTLVFGDGLRFATVLVPFVWYDFDVNYG